MVQLFVGITGGEDTYYSIAIGAVFVAVFVFGETVEDGIRLPQGAPMHHYIEIHRQIRRVKEKSKGSKDFLPPSNPHPHPTLHENTKTN